MPVLKSARREVVLHFYTQVVCLSTSRDLLATPITTMSQLKTALFTNAIFLILNSTLIAIMAIRVLFIVYVAILSGTISTTRSS